MHPLADVQASTGYKKYLVIRRNQASAIFANQERTLAIDGEWIHIMPNEAGGTTVWGVGGGSGKTTSIHFSTVIGCKVKRSHPKQFKVSFLRRTHLPHISELHKKLIFESPAGDVEERAGA
jgi:target of rapamycin complex 2 subunit MAPKAP1